MTVHEIETTLQSLYKRHENLDEAVLLVLLKAGGWEAKMIQEAVHVHRGLHAGSRTDMGEQGEVKNFLPKIQEELVLPREVGSDHLLMEHFPEIISHHDTSVHDVEKSTEPQSLVSGTSESKEVITNKTSTGTHELPHNLPIKPFDTTPHIWSFEYYKRIFYGDEPHEDKQEVVKEKQVVPKPEVKQPARSTPLVDNHKDQGGPVHHVHVEPVPLDRDDEKLVLLASVMLVTILLLLAYMYSRGRL